MTASTPALEIVEHEIGSIEVNRDGSCRWTDVANALTHIRAQLSRLPAQAANEPSDALGRWLSAALDDPTVCAEMKADISAWFAAGQPLPAQAVGEGATFPYPSSIHWLGDREDADQTRHAADARGCVLYFAQQSDCLAFMRAIELRAIPSPPAEPSGEMVEALEPFARLFDRIEDSRKKFGPAHWPTDNTEYSITATINTEHSDLKFGDLRRARAALSSAGEKNETGSRED